MTFILQKSIPKEYPKDAIPLGDSPVPEGHTLFIGKKEGRYAIPSKSGSSKKKEYNSKQVSTIQDIKDIQVSSDNINTLKKTIRNNSALQNFLKKQYAKLNRRVDSGAKIKLKPIQLLAALETGKFAFISAGKNTVNSPENHKNKDHVFFVEQNIKLQQDLKEAGFIFNQCLGKYGGLERSVLVMVHDAKDEEFIENLGKKYSQHSVIFSDNTNPNKRTNRLTKCFTPGRESLVGSDYTIVPEEAKLDENQNYTSIPLSNGKTVKILLSLPKDNTTENFWSN